MARLRLPLAAALLVVSAFVAFACFMAFGSLMGDSGRYLAIARNLADGRGFTSAASAPYWPEVFRAPLYPVFLGTLFHFGLQVKVVLVVQYLLYAATALLLWHTALSVHGDRVAADVLVAILAIHAPVIRWSVQIATESLALPLVGLSAWLLVQHVGRPAWESTVGLGLVIGMLFLTRTDYVLLLATIPIVSAVRFRGTDSIRHSALLTLVVAGVAIPWMARNVTHTGSFKPLGVGGGMALWVRSVELAVPDANEREVVVHHDPRIRALHDGSEPENLVAVDAMLTREAIQTLRDYVPQLFLGAAWKLSFRNWVEHADRRVPRAVAWLAFLWSASILGAAYFGAWLLLRPSRAARSLIVLIGSVGVVHAFLITEARYTAPLRPIVVLFAAYGVVELARRAGLLVPRTQVNDVR